MDPLLYLRFAKATQVIKVAVHIYRNRLSARTTTQRGGGPDPLKNHKNIGFLSNTGLDPLKNHKATKPAFNVGPASACQQNVISMALRWLADDGRFIAAFIYSIPHQQKKKKKKKKLSYLDPLRLGPRMTLQEPLYSYLD